MDDFFKNTLDDSFVDVVEDGFIDTEDDFFSDTTDDFWRGTGDYFKEIIELPRAATPSIIPVSGEYGPSQTITITSATGTADIHYTLDGSTPDTSDPIYSTPLAISHNLTVKTIAIAVGYTDSYVSTAAYTVTQVATPVLSPTSGEYLADQTVEITCATPSSTIYYTTDGSTPTTGSFVYTAPILIADGMTIKALAAALSQPDSEVASEEYTITQAAAPVFSPVGGTYSMDATIEITSTTPGALILYSIDGSHPAGLSNVYTGPIPNFTGTLKAVAIEPRYADSDVTSDDYVIADPQDWRDYRDMGTWVFTEQPDKWGYLNNPRWTEAKAHGDQHLPCGHWHKRPRAGGTQTVVTEISPVGEWVAALSERARPYIYFYDIALFSIIKVDVSSTPVVVDMLVVNDANYILDYSMGYGGAQRGSYCISKEYNKVWYVFRSLSTGDIRSVSVDISGDAMAISKTAIHTGVIDIEASFDYAPNKGTYLECFLDGCANDDYAFFPTTKISGRILRFDASQNLIEKECGYSSGGNFDEPINSITLNPIKNQIFWIRNNNTGPACRMEITDFNFNTTWGPYSDVDGGLDSASWQNFIRYDERTDSHFRQRVYWPANGVAYYYSNWEPDIGRAYVQGLQYMQQYLGGNSQYFYVLHANNANPSKYLHRFTHRDSTEGGALVQISTNVNAYLNRFDPYYFSNSIYNDIANQSFLISFNSANQSNYIVSMNQSLAFVEETLLNSGVSIETVGAPAFPDQNADNEPQIWAMPGEIYDESNNR